VKLRTAVVGCGALANGVHLPNISENPQLDLVVTCDQNPEAAQAAATRWGAQRNCVDWHDVVVAEDVDLLVLCTHIDLRADLICEAVARGKPVYTEKPLAGSTDELSRIQQACRSSEVPVCVGHNRRCSPAVLEFKRLFEKARAQGTDRAAIIDRTDSHESAIAEEQQTQLLIRINDDIRTWKPWALEDSTGILLSEMVHFIDLALWLMPSEPVEGYVCGSPRGNFTEIIRHADGSMVTLQHSIVGNFDYPKELIEITCRNVTIVLDHHLEVRQRGLGSEPFRTCFPLERGADLTDKAGIEAFYAATDALQQMKAEEAPLPCDFVFPGKGHYEMLECFRKHILGQCDNPCPLEDASRVTRIALTLLESARLAQPVRFES